MERAEHAQPDSLREEQLLSARIWTAQVAATALAGSVGQRDPLTGDALPRLLSEVFQSVRRATAAGRNPLPSDGLQELVEFVSGPLSEVIDRPRATIKRSHEMMALHRVRELDVKCMSWVGSQTGRTIREKLAGKPTVLGVRRSFSSETIENILVAKLLRGLLPRVDARLRAIDEGAYELAGAAADARAEALREFERLCSRALKRTEFGEIDHRRSVRPNNVLLGDRRYLKLWRGWRWLRSLETGEQGRAAAAEGMYLQAAFLSTAAGLAERLAGGRTERLLVVPGSSVSDVLRSSVEHFSSGDDGAFCRMPFASVEFICPAAGKHPRALLLLELVDSRLEVTLRASTGDGLLCAGAELRQRVHSLAFTSSREEAARGLIVRFSPAEGSPSERSADFEALRVISSAIVNDALGTAPVGGAVSAPKSTPMEGKRRCGIDLGYATPVTWVEGAAAASSVPAFILGLPLRPQASSEPEFEWMNCGEGFGADPFGPNTEFFCIRDAVERGEELSGGARIGLTKALAVLGEDLGRNYGLGADVVKPVAIPDSVDELAQQTLRFLLGASFGRVMPLWRTSCLVLAWQQQPSFTMAGVREDDGLLVLDICSEGLSVALFGAKLDRVLQSRVPRSKGIHWQRRPAISARDLDPSRAEAAKLASWREAMLSFVRRRLPIKAFGGRCSEPEAEGIRAYLVDAGFAERVFLSGRSVAIPLVSISNGWAIELTHDARDAAAVAEDYQRALARALKLILGQDLVQAYMGDIQRDRRRWHVLLAGIPGLEPAATGPFRNNGAVRSALMDAEVWSGFQLERVLSLGGSQTIAAIGAAELLSRRDAKLPSVADWLPSLSLEVIRDGGFHEYTLLEEQAVCAAAFEAVQRFPVAESLRIPAGRSEVRFPLFEGRAMRRDREVCITSSQFPLKQPLEVTAAVEYRVGEAQPYRLVFAPAETASGVQIAASIEKPKRRDGLIPSFPPERGWEDDKVAQGIALAQSRGPSIRRKLERLRSDGAVLDGDQVQRDFVPDLRTLREIARMIWSDQRVYSEAPWTVQAAIEAAFPFEWIERIAACDPDAAARLARRIPNDRARQSMRRWGRRILSYTHCRYEEALLSAVLSECAASDPQDGHIEVFGRLVGDGSGFGAPCMEHLVSAVRKAVVSPSTSVGKSTILSLADACWRHPGFVTALHAAAPGLADLYLENAKRMVSYFQRSASSDPARAFVELGPQCLRAVGETSLAFMRLREVACPPAACEAGNPTLITLSIAFCAAERALSDIIPLPNPEQPMRRPKSLCLPSFLKFDFPRDPALNKTSDLAFVLRHYLNGGSDAMIEIVGRNEED